MADNWFPERESKISDGRVHEGSRSLVVVKRFKKGVRFRDYGRQRKVPLSITENSRNQTDLVRVDFQRYRVQFTKP